MNTTPEIYTINDIAFMTGFTTRTLRTYIKNGLLKGTCLENKWIFSAENFQDFLREPYILEGIKIKYNNLIKQYLQGDPLHPELGIFHYDLPGTMDELLVILADIMPLVSGKNIPFLRYSYYYDEKQQKGRFLFIGELSLIQAAVDILQLGKSRTFSN